MLFNNVVLAATALFGFAVASPIAAPVQELALPRQAATIKASLLATEQEVIKLRDAFAASTGTDPAEVTAIRAQSDVVLAAVQSSTAVVQASPNLTLVEVLGFATTVQQLQRTLDSTIDVVIAKKPQVDELGLTAEVRDKLTQQKAAINTFGTVLLTKVPTAAKSIAQGYINNFNASFDRAIAAYTS
ncbi:hydrophobic surface binding protein A-domain-containing protein [Microdochium bolleyi]|uniref:Hydrophobic surface binding protein A-domain-containing protein n=1 Tax=Microdochium bolleyi TaxID=196109 RepID=A0A136ISX2_9PEZI|nr:hydrophobic surface binding protein A-domain-containing protein [Microdochium bolleyi]